MTTEKHSGQWFRAGVLPDASDVLGLIEQSSDIAVFLNKNHIIEGISVNPECPSLGCLDHWVGRDFNSFLTEESREKLAIRLQAMERQPNEAPRPIEINHADNTAWEFPVRYSIHRARDGALLLAGRDMQPIAEVQQRLLAEQIARERDQQKLRGEETFYRVVLDASKTPIVLVDPDQGRIRNLNSAAAMLLGAKPDALSGNAFAQAFEGRRRSEFMEALRSATEAEEHRFIEVTSRRNSLPLRLYPEFFRAAGKLFLLCCLESVSDEDGTNPQMSTSLLSLFTSASDAIVLTDGKGNIREANEAFLIMTDALQLRDVKDRPLSDFLARGMVDLKLMLESATKRERLKGYATQLMSVAGTRVNVEISAANLHKNGGEPGFGLIIRDVQPVEMPNAGASPAAVSEDAMKSVMDLVGTASLKQLVSATSDVVEKMCIETAVQLTGNNRVAAAEMLGVSRQSLYVKLRKHGLIGDEASDTDSGGEK